MQLLSHQGCVEWAAKRNYPLRTHANGWVSLRRDFADAGFYVVPVDYPADSGRKAHLAKELYSRLSPEEDCLLWIDNWTVWPSSQHLPLFERLRHSLGESRSLAEAPGHLVSAKEADDAVSILLVALLFIWDCHVLAASGRAAIFVSHDEYCWFGSRNA